MDKVLIRHAGLATAWMREVEQRMEQLPNPASISRFIWIPGQARNDGGVND